MTEWWIPVFTGMTKYKHLHNNDKIKIMDSCFYVNDRIEDWIPVYTGMTKNTVIPTEVGIYITDKKTGFPFFPAFTRTGMTKWRNFPMIDKIESTLVIDKIKIMDSRFHGNDRMVGITNGKTRFPFSRE